MLLKSLAILSISAISFNVVPSQQQGKLVKYVDNEIRKEYYLSCRQDKRKGCHMAAFNESIRLKWEK